MKSILLVNPEYDNEALWVTGDEIPGRGVVNNMVPLGLATVAGLTPAGYQVDIWDELVHGRIGADTRLARPYDLVGITGYKTHLPRCRQIAAVFRGQGVPVAVGGPGVSGSPDAYRGDFDILFIGEAERTWPQFLQDWERGEWRAEYRQIEKPDLASSPLPRWDSIVEDMDRYAMGCVQTTRGCPFDCEFCDVIYLFGRRSRHKPIERVLDEVRALERLGMSAIFFCDDEFIGDPRYTKELLRALVPLNASFARPLSFSTQLTMNLSRDDELLELMADANFYLVFIGIETPNKESLRETHKYQNVRADLAADVHKILSYGIAIRAGIIVGFDHDDHDIFDMQHDFIQQACLPSLGINMLKAPLETRLWTRLRQEGRIVTLAKLKESLGHPRSYTNILPKRMSRVELMRGYRELLRRVHTWEAFAERMRGFVSAVRRAPQVREAPLSGGEARRLCAPLTASADGRRAIEDVLAHTERTAPFMLRRVKTLIVQFARYQDTLAGVLPQIDRQIELESRGAFPLELDNRPVPIPAGFRAAFDRVFPDVHHRVYANMADAAQVPEALTEIFVDFLVRWAEGFTDLEPYHRVFLDELCDRTCAKFNGVPPQEFVSVPWQDVPVPNVRRTRLGEDVLKMVEQELIKLVQAQASPAGVGGPRVPA